MDRIANAYIELLKKSLMDVLTPEESRLVPLQTLKGSSLKLSLLKLFDAVIRKRDFLVVREVPLRLDEKLQGKGMWPRHAKTMIGMERLNNIQRCIEDTIADRIPGDLIETGVWRGGATIFMRGLLKAHGVSDKIVWVADSFEGLPVPDGKKYPADKDSRYHDFDELRVSLDEVKNNFLSYDLLDSQVQFLKGWFKDTLPNAPMKSLSILRLDGDMYESTMDALVNLYPKLSVGGYVIVDDYSWIESCRQAVDDYRTKHGITSEMRKVDWTAVYWRK